MCAYICTWWLYYFHKLTLNKCYISCQMLMRNWSEAYRVSYRNLQHDVSCFIILEINKSIWVVRANSRGLAVDLDYEYLHGAFKCQSEVLFFQSAFSFSCGLNVYWSAAVYNVYRNLKRNTLMHVTPWYLHFSDSVIKIASSTLTLSTILNLSRFILYYSIYEIINYIYM